MGLLSALNAAASGLRTTQDGINLVAQNVANADTAGYTRRRLVSTEASLQGRPSGVRTAAIERILDTVAQKQLRLETAGAAYTSLMARFTNDVDRLFGEPGGASSLDTLMNGFVESLQGLLSDPASYDARSRVVDRAAALAHQIGAVADGIQDLRTQAEERLDAAVARANDLLKGVAAVNAKIVGQTGAGSIASLLDERDRLIGELSQLMDVQSVQGANGSISLMTTGGLTLFDGSTPTELRFDSRAPLGPTDLYSTDDAKRGVGTITIVGAGGTLLPLSPHSTFRSGEIAAALELRDTTLVQAQRQLDELAAGLALSMSETTDEGTTAPPLGAAQGLELDLSTAQAGDVIRFSYKDAAGQQRDALIQIRVGGVPSYTPSSLLPNEPIYTLDLSALDPANQLGLQLPDFQVQYVAATPGPPSTPPLLRLYQNAAQTNQVTGLTLSTTASSGTTIALFVDDATDPPAPFTGVYAAGHQIVGFAQRMMVNPEVVDNRSLLVRSSSTTPNGDTARPQHLLDSITKSTRSFAAASGIAGNGGPYSSTVLDFAQRVIATQGANAEQAQLLDEGQKIALSAIEGRFIESAEVNLDQEMAQLVALQTAYGANARVMTAARDMIDMLMRL